MYNNLIILNPTKGKNTDVKKGTKLQIRYGRNKGTLYNATVTEVLDDEHVKVCTKDKDPDIAETKDIAETRLFASQRSRRNQTRHTVSPARRPTLVSLSRVHMITRCRPVIISYNRL